MSFICFLTIAPSKQKNTEEVQKNINLFWFKLFLIISNWDQFWQIFHYSNGIFDFYSQIINYFYVFLFTIPVTTLIFSILFSILVFYFWFTYFKVYFCRLPESKIHGSAKYKVLANFFTFLGFGCVACGQTLLYSILLFFGSSTSLFLGEYIGNFVMLIGAVFLIFGIYENQKLFKNKNVCAIEM